MKRILKIVVITSIVMLAGLSALAYFGAKKEKELSKIAEQKEKEEKDILTENAEKAYIKINDFEIVPLVLEGDGHNVLTYAKNSVDEIYNVENSKKVMDELQKIGKKGEYTIENPLCAWNPFGTNTLSMYMYFKTKNDSYIKYTISVEDTSIPDYTRTLYNGTSKKCVENHEYQITGFVPGAKNYLVVNQYNKKDGLEKTVTFSVQVPDNVISPKRCKYEEGESKQTIQNGLYVVFKQSNTRPVIGLYDNSGILRAEIPLKNYRSDRLVSVYDTLAYSYSKTGIAEVSRVGQVVKVFSMDGYEQHHDFVYDGYGNFLVLATDTSKKRTTTQDVIVQIEEKTGKVTKLLDLASLMKTQKELAKSKAKKMDWITLNSIQAVGVNGVLVSSRELSSIIKIGNIRSEVPSVEYILADKALYNGSTFASKLLTKSYEEGKEPEETEPVIESILETVPEEDIPFVSQYGQNSIVYEENDKLEEGQYYIYLFNNNFGYTKTNSKFNWSKVDGVGMKNLPADNSHYYKYLVDETNRVYYLVDETPLPYTAYNGNVQVYKKEHFVTCTADAQTFSECDKNGETVRKYHYGAKLYKVEKQDMKNYWYK